MSVNKLSKKKFNKEIDFTCHFNDPNIIISSIRITKYKKNIEKSEYVVITIYYPFRSGIFFLDNTFNIDGNKNSIFETDTDHQKNFHKLNDPYDYHIHIKIEKNRLFSLLNKIFSKYKISTEKLLFIESIYFGRIKYNNNNNINLDKLEIEYKGNNNTRDFLLNKIILLKYNLRYDILKYDKNLNNSYFTFGNYYTRVINYIHSIKLKKSIFEKLQNYNKILSKTQININFYNGNDLIKSNNDMSQIIYNIKKLITLYCILNNQENSLFDIYLSKNIFKSKSKNSINNTIKDISISKIRKINIDYHSKDDKFEINVYNLNNIYKELINKLLSIKYGISESNPMLQYISILYLSFIKYHINYGKNKMSALTYIETRLNMELGWNLFQAIKFKKQNNTKLSNHFLEKVNLLLDNENQNKIFETRPNFNLISIKKNKKVDKLINIIEPKILLIKNKINKDDIITTKAESCLL